MALQASNQVAIVDAYDGESVGALKAIDGAGGGLAPEDVLPSPDGTRLFVHHFLSREVTVHDTTGVLESTSFSPPLLARIPTVSGEALSPDVLRGKQIFYDARDPRMSLDG